jgi:hypothetical protein
MVLLAPSTNHPRSKYNHDMSELGGLLIGLILTLFIYSYLLGDNPLYRLAAHILVGVSAAYAAVVIVQQVLLPAYNQMRQEPAGNNLLLWFVPLLFALLLLLRRLSSLSWWSNNTMALLIGIGAAVALIGALTGTLWPQITAVNNPDQAQTLPGRVGAIQGLLVALLTVCTLLTFQFTGRTTVDGEWVRPLWQRGLAQVGRAVIAITFGALFAGVLSTSLILLTNHVGRFLNEFLQRLP